MVEFKVSNDSSKRHLKEDELFELVMYLWMEQGSMDDTSTISSWCKKVTPLLREGVYPENLITELLTFAGGWFNTLDEDQQLLLRCSWEDSFPHR